MIANQLKSLEARAKGFSEEVQNTTLGQVQDLKELATKQINAVASQLQNIESQLTEQMKLVESRAEKTAKGFADSVQRTAEMQFNQVKGFAETVEKNAKQGIGEVRGIAKQVEDTAIKGISEVKGVADEAQKGVTRLENLIDKQIKRVEGLVEKTKGQIEDNVLGKFESFGKGFVSVMTDAIVKPFKTLFTGLGNIFNQLFGILKEIGNKIVSLPGCVLFYIVDTTYNTITGISKSILPRFITNIFGGIYDYIFHPIIYWFLNLFGYYDSEKKCYGFDVDQQVDKISKEFNEIGASFTDGFGKFNLKNIKL
jgi:flagellar biosynthesis chaperone FliJ